MKVAFLGLGVMGAPMAGHLVRAGHEVAVYNRTSSRARAWVAVHGGRAAPSPAEAVQGAHLVFACVGRDADVRAVTLEAGGAFAAMMPGAVFVDHTTTSADLARELASAATGLGLGFVDAPVSGGQAGAENGKLTIMCGGSEADYATALPVMQVYAKAVRRLGGPGAGQTAKMANQICIAGVVQGLAEAIHFTQKAGLDPAEVIAAISQGAAQSWQMDNRHATMIADQFEFGFAVDWMRKDLGICLDEGRRVGATLPLTALVDQFYGEVQAMGGGRWDTSSLIRRLRAFDRGQ